MTNAGALIVWTEKESQIIRTLPIESMTTKQIIKAVAERIGK